MKTAAAYLRVSNERQDEFSPDSQLKLIRDYCKKNDIELPDELVFYDDGISAKTAKKRTQFNNMIALAKQKEKPFDIILVWKFSRFARNQEESIVYKSLLRKKGIEVISISEPIQDNPFGGLIERIIEWMDEYYLIRLSDEVRRGMTERATRGLPNCAPPFGYKMVDGEYCIEDEEAKWVKKIFEMYIAGVPKRNIATTLQSCGVKNHYGNSIDLRGITYILNNPVYNGYVRWNPHNRTSSARKFGESSDIVKKSTHPAIIDNETWSKAQEILSDNKKLHSKYMRENPTGTMFMLRGICKCGDCGATLVYTSTQAPAIQCHNYARGNCPVSHSITLNRMNKMVIDKLKECVRTFTFNVSPQNNLPINADQIDYQNLINIEKAKLDRAKQAYQEGVDSLSEYRTTKQKIEKKIAELKKEQAKEVLQTTNNELSNLPQKVESVIAVLEDPTVSEELKNITIKSIVEKIVFYRPGNYIDIYFR